MTFLLAFINQATTMNKNCTKSPNQCQYGSIDQWNPMQLFTCRMCNKLVEHELISVHACNDGCICRMCLADQYLINETKIDSEFNKEDEQDFSPISSIHTD